MPTQSEVLEQIVRLVGDGAGAPVASEVAAALRARYSEWLVTPGKKVKTRPIDVWEEEDGKKIQAKFQEIGRRMVKKSKDKKKDKIDSADCTEACREVETAATSDCPHCPDPGI
ncbi:MAG TPA: hypothetical protein VJ725_31970 [Thermoanaerobaculia bacterium]|nr:hypothetical protein [Thermoanaerobaculia bacterium]